jgi:hypothetical protein
VMWRKREWGDRGHVPLQCALVMRSGGDGMAGRTASHARTGSSRAPAQDLTGSHGRNRLGTRDFERFSVTGTGTPQGSFRGAAIRRLERFPVGHARRAGSMSGRPPGARGGGAVGRPTSAACPDSGRTKRNHRSLVKRRRSGGREPGSACPAGPGPALRRAPCGGGSRPPPRLLRARQQTIPALMLGRSRSTCLQQRHVGPQPGAAPGRSPRERATGALGVLLLRHPRGPR